MSPAKHTANEEDAFMQDLLSGLDNSFWNASPTPSPAKPKQKTTPITPEKKQPSTPPKVLSTKNVNLTDLLEGAEDWDFSDDFLTPKKETKKKEILHKPPPQLAQKSFKSAACTRCIVQAIEEHQVGSRHEKNLIVRIDGSKEKRSIVLRDDWIVTDVRKGDIVNIIGDFTILGESSSSLTSSVAISSKSNLLILHPDILITATALSNTPQCRRKPLISSLVRSSSDYTPSLVWGNMLHSVLQACLLADRWDEVWVDDKIDEIVRSGLSDLVRINTNVDQAKREVKARAKGLHVFSEKYIAPSPKPGANLTNSRGGRDDVSLLAISTILDIEEDIWSPSYGLKGKLDATVQTVISEMKPPFYKPVFTNGPKPLELKTGRAMAGMEHRAQTMLYSLLAEERYGLEVSSGLLYYTQSEEVVQVDVNRNELRGLIMARNEMASYMVRRHQDPPERFLPPTLDDERLCKRCYVLDTCMLYRKAVENVEDTNSPIADAYSLKTSHLSPSHAAFFKQWEHLVSLEESDMSRFKKELWTMGASERESKGRCFGSMVIDSTYHPLSQSPASRDTKIHQYTYKFLRSTGYKTSSSLLSGFLNAGDAVTISVEPHLLALARGFILELTPTDVIVGVDHDLSLLSIRDRLSAFGPVSPEIIFRIDRDELYGGMGRIRENLAQLFYLGGDTRRLELVVDLKYPSFSTEPLPLPPSVARYSAHLNANQMQAMNKVLSAEDYALILGMPGTGKTTIVAAIIKTVVAMGKTVLLTSYTHSAVDNILLKLKDVEFGILRLGNTDKVHPDIRPMTLSSKRAPTTVEQLEFQIMTPPVVATTCLSIDKYVRNKEARQGGLDVSLFRRLSDAHAHSVVDLAYQYRMNSDIMMLSNKLIYGDRLRCGSQAVANHSLVLPNRDFLKGIHGGKLSCHSSDCWIEQLMSKSCKAVFVDTDLVPAQDSKVGDLVQNEVEASLVYQVTETMLRSGVSPDQIGIISLYRQQVKLLTQMLHEHKGIEVLTADRSQGRDKDCIIISMVRSNEDGSIGDLVKDWRRMNVSFTRARSKLIIFGSRNTLQDAPLLKEFFTLMEEQKWIVQLPPKADISHARAFDVATSPKRVVEDVIGQRKENADCTRPQKKLKVKKGVTEAGLLRSRPILRDLVNDGR
ncbi:Dna2-domain-containing protein [Guyanagaster necrorhizus]|uniref:DNA replication ATP-dependent helicase/nuclease DNA2 n=1 Tax=Guyanagaster necrorhizus TaxID=856835 RepID=A0A9P7VHP3_9AGAR|nr:Dna2-domain-containing protein [Guyanagaster necrorhizus MCA 3950]KAG7440565.1 Dna2-domain-containing protein [Guyanagaster necrorhizus MCA 3950]